MTGATVLLFFNKCLLLLLTISNVLNILNWGSDQSCDAQIVLQEVLFILSTTIAAALSALRVYAVGERSWFWTLLTLLAGLVPAAADSYLNASAGRPYVAFAAGLPVCMRHNVFSRIVYNRFIIASLVCAIVSDLIVIGATWMYAMPWARRVSETQIKRPLMLVILRDGIGYFIILLLNHITRS
ncbi:hypothetical protein WOLCODRAFT_140122 [Wolfiporia cocos MD-104 SS10]|uniref:Uncharacterized protein n=1 Tax=Wolfiporia cocos (strain MD-104) TaxID=742152 RepID=A0A2H3J142_WOLCO|nr:hypothetical protein WOLCODRAFT_140122 [Wolfiporia cocos MD-104 SS10]